MIQDIAPMQLDNSYKKKVPHASSSTATTVMQILVHLCFFMVSLPF